jgi:hypothetical protein
LESNYFQLVNVTAGHHDAVSTSSFIRRPAAAASAWAARAFVTANTASAACPITFSPCSRTRGEGHPAKLATVIPSVRRSSFLSVCLSLFI